MNGVVAVVAAFRPDDDIALNVRRTAAQVDHVVVVDDGSGDGWDERLDALRSDHVTVVRLEENGGIAAALNQGVAAALELGADAVLTMDQDSRLSDDYVRNAREAAHRLDTADRSFAAVAAGVQSGTVVRPVVHHDRGDRLTPTMEAIQSGLLIPRSVIERLGGFDESLFIDCVDTDFVLRAARAGLPTYLDRSCRIEHPLGRTIDVGPVRVTRSGSRTFAFHPAWRRYYISRNRAVMLGRHGMRRPRWALLSVAGEAVQLARSIVFGPEKTRQAAAVALGVLDAVRGRRGRLAGRPALVLGAPR